ncbi:MAG: AAA family ATPase [Anaerolineae bacterium]
MAILHLYLLGFPRLERENEALPALPAKATALLAYLALTRTPQARDRLLALLWAESAEEAARKNLRNTLWTLRKTVGEDVIGADNNRLLLRDDVWVDVTAFEQMVMQPILPAVNPNLELYGGPFLDGLALTEAPEFELWAVTQRERLKGLYVDLLNRLVEFRRMEQNWSAVIALAQQALLQDPLQETMYSALMDAYTRSGDRAEALRQYDLLKATLNSELGVEPLPETENLRQSILSGELRASTTMPAVVIPREERHAATTTADGAKQAPFIGRTQQLAALTAELDSARRGTARIVLLVGEMGIGKTRLWREWTAGLPDDYLALEARFLESTQALPFAPLRDLFSSRVCAQRLFSAQTPLSSVWLSEIARLFPELRVTFPNLPTPVALPADEERRRLLEAFTQGLLGLEAKPLILFFDDMQWADRATLDWFDYLIHRLRDQPLLLAGAYRPNEATQPLSNLLSSWLREGIAQRLALEPLSEAESWTLAQSISDDRARQERAVTLSAGNPHFLIALSHAETANVPPTLVELTSAHLNRLPEMARQVLQAAAVLEPDFKFPILVRVSGRSEDETLDALDSLLSADILTEREDNYSFNHPLIPTVVRNTMSAARSAVLHRRAAQALESEYADRLPQIAARLADYYERAGNPIQAASYADMAADHARSLIALPEAESFFRLALQLEPTPLRHIKLGNVLFMQNNLSGARAEFTSALVMAEQQSDMRVTLDAMLSMADTYVPTGQADEIDRWLVRAANLLEAESDPQLQARAHFLAGVSAIAHQRPLREAELHLAEVNRLTRENNLKQMAGRAMFEVGNLMAERGDLKQAVAAYREAVAWAQAVGDSFQEALGYNNAAYHTLLLGDLEQAKQDVTAGLDLAQAAGLRVPLQYLYSTRGEIALAETQPDDAEKWFRQGLEEAEHGGNLRQLANYQANLALAARQRGDLDAALTRLLSARDQVASVAAPHLQTQINLWLTELYMQRGEMAHAREALAAADSTLAESDRQRLKVWADRLRHKLMAVKQ